MWNLSPYYGGQLSVANCVRGELLSAFHENPCRFTDLGCAKVDSSKHWINHRQ